MALKTVLILDNDKDFLNEYAKIVYEKYINDLDFAIRCFEELEKQTNCVQHI